MIFCKPLGAIGILIVAAVITFTLIFIGQWCITKMSSTKVEEEDIDV